MSANSKNGVFQKKRNLDSMDHDGDDESKKNP
jgi:hypothetical protein